jgi:xylulose-5-phosphate/fructose-6-phosphate phosphoketolase
VADRASPDTTARYRRACDFLALAMIYLRDNVLLREPLAAEHLKPRVLGHWGTCPGLTLVYAGLNGLVRRTGQRTLLVTGPGHGAPAIHANLWLEGSHADHDKELSRDGAGLRELIRRFSWPGGFPSHLSPEVPGVIHEGGELGYALATAAGAALDKPDLLVACIVGDGEAETGPTAGSWQTSKFLDPLRDGAVLPILHLNGSKIASPTVFSAMSDEDLRDYFRGAGWTPTIVRAHGVGGADDAALSEALDSAHREIESQRDNWGRANHTGTLRPPMIVLRSPKGMGAPSDTPDGTPLAGTFHAHQVPLGTPHTDAEQLAALERWLRSYRPEELFTDHGCPAADLLGVPPEGVLRLGAVPEANGGALRRALPLPDLSDYEAAVPVPGAEDAGATEVAARWLAELMRRTEQTRDFRIVCPDELESNNLGGVLEATHRAFSWTLTEHAEQLGPGGRVMEVLSEHLCQGWLQGYLLTGRHGLFPCYEAFASIVDSMANQYAKFLTMSRAVPWREPVSAFTYLLSSDGWRQEHNGYSHQGPGFLSNLLTKRPEVTRVYLPPDANTLLVVLADALAATGRINLVVAGKQSGPQWLDLPAARRHCARGADVWEWAGQRDNALEPDVVLCCAGTTPTVETLAAADLLREHAPELRVRVSNAVDLRVLSGSTSYDERLSEEAFTSCFGGPETPVVFAFHGYPSAVHELLHGRPGPNRFHVHGYLEEGTTTTPYVLLASNRMTRHDLAADALRRVLGPGEPRAARLEDERDDLVAQAHRDGEDAEQITGWRWQR